MADHLLDLTTLTERPTIKIDGKSFEILHPDELSVIDFARFRIKAQTVSEILRKEEPAEEDAAALGKALGDLTDRIMQEIPAEVRDTLTEGQRLLVAEVFMELPRAAKATKPTVPKKELHPSRRPGPKPRSGASGSTAAIPAAG